MKEIRNWRHYVILYILLAMIHMPKTRLEAFSDGVIAIIITIMVLEIKVPHGTELAVLTPLLPVFLSYALSFIYIGIYWNNHHHLLHVAKQINGKIMWANLHFLFWLSLVPFATGWLGENHGETWPTVVYGSVLLMSGIAYLLLQSFIIGSHEKNSPLAEIFGKDWKGKLSLLSYAVAIGLAFMNKWISDVIYVCVAMIWLIPDRRIERLPPIDKS